MASLKIDNESDEHIFVVVQQQTTWSVASLRRWITPDVGIDSGDSGSVKGVDELDESKVVIAYGYNSRTKKCSRVLATQIITEDSFFLSLKSKAQMAYLILQNVGDNYFFVVPYSKSSPPPTPLLNSSLHFMKISDLDLEKLATGQSVELVEEEFATSK